jgi:hypothetical protein
MTYLTVSLALATLLDADRPYAGRMVSQSPQAVLTQCIADRMDNYGKVQVKPGNPAKVAFVLRPLGVPSFIHSALDMTITDDGMQRVVTVTYGHPMTAKTVARQLRILARKCGGVTEETP